jgi:membrane protein implicated in regulation of membrane protease activity
MKDSIIALFIFLSAVVVVLGLLHYFDVLAVIALLIGFGVLIAIILFTIVTGVVLIVAVPYYLLAKKPKIDEYGNYKLEDVKGKEE